MAVGTVGSPSRDELAARIAAGRSQLDVATEFGCTDRTVRRWAAGFGLVWDASVAAPPPVVPRADTSVYPFAGVAPDVVAGVNTQWLGWDGRFHPVAAGMTGREWNRVQNIVHLAYENAMTAPPPVPAPVSVSGPVQPETQDIEACTAAPADVLYISSAPPPVPAVNRYSFPPGAIDPLLPSFAPNFWLGLAVAIILIIAVFQLHGLSF